MLSRVSENALVHWYCSYDDDDNMYVPIKLSDWDDSNELEEEFAEDDDAGKDMPQLVEEEDK